GHDLLPVDVVERGCVARPGNQQRHELPVDRPCLATGEGDSADAALDVLIVDVAEEVPAHSDVDGEPGSGLEIVQPIESKLVLAADQGGLAFGSVGVGVIAEQKSGEAVGDADDVSGEVDLAPREVGAGAAADVVAIDPTELEIVLAAVDSEALGELVDIDVV